MADHVENDLAKLKGIGPKYAEMLKEVGGLMEALNKLIPADQPKITLPDVKFHRSIGEYAEKTYSTGGDVLEAEAYARHLEEVLPNETDKARLAQIFKEPGWVLAV